ncbi:hypothetical protein [Psychrobacillus sp.]|uniref:hypothetical protein n=1 Tax=Psychrobacillus sp. TaxID=1871623 RepID=UPI0028BDED3C|nr:hypothetical protein [Psychrobacillus sp.]
MDNGRQKVNEIQYVIELMQEDSGKEETLKSFDSFYEEKMRLIQEIRQLEEGILEKLIKVIEMR